MLGTVLCVALMVLGWRLIWLHDTSSNTLWHSNWWAVAGVCAVMVGAFGFIFTIGQSYGGVI